MTNTGKWVLGGIGVFFALFVLFWAAILYYIFSDSEDEVYSSGSGGTIAVVELKEEIISSESIVRQFKKYREDRSVKAIVFRIESPGGGVAASQEIYEEVKRTRDQGKPVVVSMGSVAASGGYYIACGASRIVANPGTLTGSIGVISQFMHFNQLMEKVGVASTTIKSGKFKDVGSPFRVPSEEEKKYFQETIDDVFAQFLSVVEKERKLPHEKAKALADGRVFSGARAYAVGLIDTLGTFEDAISIAANKGHITGTPRIIKEKKRERFADYVFGSLASGFQGVRQEVLGRPILQYSLIKP
ncbi:MAG: signal peptide peptidase SppA [Ignavibacteriales bacterium]|nr:signal peptide peptidase SppA [Ignavibacteriales bacterium]